MKKQNNIVNHWVLESCGDGRVKVFWVTSDNDDLFGIIYGEKAKALAKMYGFELERSGDVVTTDDDGLGYAWCDYAYEEECTIEWLEEAMTFVDPQNYYIVEYGE